MDTERAVAFPGFADRLTADYDAGLFQVFGEAGSRFETEAATFEAFVALAHIRLRTDGFAENGEAALTGGDREIDATFMTFGLHGATDFAIGGMKTTAHGTLGWRHAVGDTDPFSTHAFSGGDAFTLTGAPIAENATIIRAGLDFDIAENTRLGVSYSGQIASDAQEHGFNAKLNIRF